MTVVDRDGAALAGVRVVGGPHGAVRSDARGRVVLENVPDGTWELRLDEPGIVFGAARATVEGGGAAAVTLREGPSYDLMLSVTDETGAPAKFARISVVPARSAPWVHLVDGVQTLTVLTDEQGRCTLPDLPWLKVTIRARFGSRTATAELAPGADVASLQLGHEGAVVLR